MVLQIQETLKKWDEKLNLENFDQLYSDYSCSNKYAKIIVSGKFLFKLSSKTK